MSWRPLARARAAIPSLRVGRIGVAALGLLAVAGVTAVTGPVAWAGAGAGAQDTITLVALGDSLTAGNGLHREATFPVRLEQALNLKGYKVAVVNAGVSGDTTASGLARLDWSVGPDADGVIVELGANDALRGLKSALVAENMDALLTRLSLRKLPVLLAGMLAPRNMGADYSVQFDAIYPALAKRHDVEFYPFFLDGVAAVPKLFQADGLHPTAKGVEVIVQRILPSVEALIGRIRSKAKPAS